MAAPPETDSVEGDPVGDRVNREIKDALVGLLEQVDVDELQIIGGHWPTPAAVTLDVYPDNPFQDNAGFGPSSLQRWLIRARVPDGTDNFAGQDKLLDLLEWAGPTSVRQALTADLQLGGLATGLDVDPASGFQLYTDGTGVTLVGCEWRVQIYTNGATP